MKKLKSARSLSAFISIFILVFSNFINTCARESAPEPDTLKPFRVINMENAHTVPEKLNLPVYRDYAAFEAELIGLKARYTVYYEGGSVPGLTTLKLADEFMVWLKNGFVTYKGFFSPGETNAKPAIDAGSFTVFQNGAFLKYFNSYNEAAAYAKSWANAVIAGEMVVSHRFLKIEEYKLYNVKEYDSFETLPEAVNFAKKTGADGLRAVIAVGSPEYERSRILWENAPHTGGALIEDVPHISQLPELPRGCEVTALAMLINFRGLMVDKETLAREIRKSEVRHDNPNNGFIGDMYALDTYGLGVYHKPIAELARGYMPKEIVDISGCDFEDLFYFLDRGRPVWIITNSRYSVLPDSEFVTWQTPDGPMKVTNRMHSVLVVGYDDKYIYFHDPYTRGYLREPRGSFINGWKQMGNQAISTVS